MLDSSKFNYEPYVDNRVSNHPGFTVGLSGPLLLGINRETGKKYIIKHTYPHNAANEYAACWLAGKIGVPTSKAYLLSPNRVFRTSYAVAIEYIDGFRAFPKEAVPEKLKPDLIAQFTLCLILQLSDAIQMNATDDHIYSYDFSEGFNVSNLDYVLAAKSIDDMSDRLAPIFREFRRRSENEDFNIPGLAREFHLDPDDMKNGMLSVLKRVLTITDSDIREMSDELQKMYPLPIAIYYEECIHEIIAEGKRLVQGHYE